MTAKSIKRFGIPHGYFLDLLDISVPHEYADVCYLYEQGVTIFSV